jgi:integrase
MPRVIRDTNLERPTGRLRLPQSVYSKPYWRSVERGLHIGYRKPQTGTGTWVGRRATPGERTPYVEQTIGKADDLEPANGRDVLSFYQAQAAVRAWWKQTAEQPAEQGAFTVNKALDIYFAAREKRGSKGVGKDRSNADVRIRPQLGELAAAALTTQRITDWHNALASSSKLVRNNRLTPTKDRKTYAVGDSDGLRARRSSANRALTVLKASLNFCFRKGRIETDTAWRVVQPFHGVDAAVVRYLSADETTRLINATSGAFRNLVLGALATACRMGELSRMTVADFNAEASTVTVRLSKSGQLRHVYLAADGLQLFTGLCAGRAATDLIFPRDNGAAWRASDQQRPLVEAAKRAGIADVSFHILRHTVGSALAMRGVPMGVIAAQLGHAGTRMTEKHYAHLAPSYVGETIRQNMPSLGIEAPKVTPLRQSQRKAKA